MRTSTPGKLSSVAFAAILSMMFATSPAQAQESGAPGTTAGNSSSPVAGSNAIAAAEQYWTPERMRNATPVQPKTHTQPGDHAEPSPDTGEPVRVPGVTPQHGGPSTTDASIHSMSGKVFFVNDRGQDRVCSGSTVNSPGKRLVFTAGHCVHGGGSDRDWADVEKWAFVPNYHGGSPHGTWHAYQLWSKNGWIDNGDRSYDVAAVVMQDKNGQHIVDAVGGQGIQWNYGYERDIYNFGYPSDGPYPGDELYYCNGTTWNDWGFVAIGCSYTAGASGGPWLANYGDEFWAHLNGVNSWYFWRNDDPQNSVYKWQTPYFSEETAGSLYNKVKDM